MEEWLESDLARAIIRDIDSSEVLSGECISSPVLGQIPPERLSGGTKTLLLMLNEPEKIFNASTCEDNCAKWIKRFGDELNITISLEHFMDFGDNRFPCIDADTGEVTDYYDFMIEKL